MSLESVIKFIGENQQNYIDRMVGVLKIQSVSMDPAKKGEIQKCASAFADILKNIGAGKVSIMETAMHPVVYGEMVNDTSKPTILIYGHYDVQPAKKSDGWNTEPFEPVIKDGFIYGRGTADDKGKLMVALNAIEAYVKTGTKLPVNFKFLIEGEEELSVLRTAEFVRKHKDMLKCDSIFVADTPWLLPDGPSITYSLRGICYWTVDLKGPNRDLHSGIYGGNICNPINAAAWMISKLVNDKGKILIPGFYDDVVPLKDVERREFASLPFDDSEILKDVDVSALWGEESYTALERNWARPVIDVNGIWGGHQGDGKKNIIPSEAHFKISARLVANQDAYKINDEFIKYINEICPPGIKVKVTTLQRGSPVMTPVDNKFLKALSEACEKGFGKKPVLIRNGASIAVTAVLKEVLGSPILFFDLNVPDENMHGPNEKLSLDIFNKGIKTAAYFYELAGK